MVNLIELKKREILQLEELLILNIRIKLSYQFDLTEYQKDEIVECRINHNKRMSKLIDELIDLGMKKSF